MHLILEDVYFLEAVVVTQKNYYRFLEAVVVIQ